MPSYGSLHSPSIHKINGGMDGKIRRSSGTRSISLSNILGDPFALATLSIAMLAWSISLIGSIIATTQGVNPNFPNYSWFALAYMISCIIGIFIVVASDTIQTYHIAIVGFLSCGLVLTSSSINSLIYSSNGAKQAVAAGHILLSMVNIIWIFYFGSTPSAMPRAYLDSFALHKDRRASQSVVGEFPGMGGGIREIGGGSIVENRTSIGGMVNEYGKLRPDTSISSTILPQMYSPAQIAGLKSSSPPINMQGVGSTPDQASFQQRFGSMAPMSSGNLGTVSQMSIEPNAAELSMPTEYPYKAKAIYSYEANPEDANEISFSKHEILDVSDVSGRWWQAKKENGETGIAPSNYLILL